MKPDRMSVRLHLRRMRAIGVVVDLIERLVVEVVDARRVVRCSDTSTSEPPRSKRGYEPNSSPRLTR